MPHYVVSYERRFHCVTIKTMFRKVGRLRLRINMQTIHFSQVGIVEYRDNYFSVPKTTYIISSKYRYIYNLCCTCYCLHIFCNNLTTSMLALCATLRLFQKPINYYARHSELTYERHRFSCLASRRKLPYQYTHNRSYTKGGKNSVH